jgi:hypothetical protein
VGLKLHLLGYDRVPKAVDQIATRLESKLGSLDMYHLQRVFKCFDQLPTSYHRRLFGLLYKEVLNRMDRELFQLNFLPVSRLTREQLEAFMKAYVGKGLYIRNCIYFINCEDSQEFFTSEVFLNALKDEFLRPLRAQENLVVDYSSYMSVGRSLLDYCQSDDPIRPQLIAQLRAVQQAVLKHSCDSWLAANTSLCSWFNACSLDQELQLLEDRRKLVVGLEEELRRFSAKKFSSHWKARKHHQQIRETLRKHANSPLPEIRRLVIALMRSEVAGSTSFDSNYFPAYLYILEDCEHSAAYQQVLSPLYSLLRGEEAMAFIEAYIRSPKKSAKLTLTIMEKLWAINRTPLMMLKLAAAVPRVYFENGLRELLPKAAGILEDVAIFLKGEDLEQLSMGELTSIVGFCRKFVKTTRILSHKLLVLALGSISVELKDKDVEVQIEALIELLALALELNYSDKEICIARINEHFQKIG